MKRNIILSFSFYFHGRSWFILSLSYWVTFCTILSWQMPIVDEKWVYIHFQEIKSSCISHNCKKEIEENKDIKNSPSYMQIRKTCANAYKINQKLVVIWSCKGKHNPCLFMSKSFIKKKAFMLSTTKLSPLSQDE